MNFLLDQGVSRSAVAMLRRAGHHAEHVADIGMSRAPDAVIMEHAVASGDIVVTLDADFHKQLAQTRALQPSVIRIREEYVRGEEATTMILTLAARAAADLLAGAAVSVSRRGFRVRRLPIGDTLR